MASCNRNSYLIVIQLYRVRLSQAPAYSCRVGVACFVIHPQLVALGASCEVLNTARHSRFGNNDHCTFWRLRTDMYMSQRRERARRAPQGTARRGGTDFSTSRAATSPTTTSTRGCKAHGNGIAICVQERCRASAVELRRAARLDGAPKTAHARPQSASMRRRCSRARGAAAPSSCKAA